MAKQARAKQARAKHEKRKIGTGTDGEGDEGGQGGREGVPPVHQGCRTEIADGARRQEGPRKGRSFFLRVGVRTP